MHDSRTEQSDRVRVGLLWTRTTASFLFAVFSGGSYPDDLIPEFQSPNRLTSHSSPSSCLSRSYPGTSYVAGQRGGSASTTENCVEYWYSPV
jgi:hypothetical protein